MRYLSVKQILLIHSMVVDETGGMHGVRNLESLDSAAALPKQVVFKKELYPDVYTKAAVYARTILMNHPFFDGNKRTGISVAIVFLEDNGFVFSAKVGELEKFAVNIVTKKLSIEAIAEWLKKHTR